MRGPVAAPRCDAISRCGSAGSTAKTPNDPPPGLVTCCQVPVPAVPSYRHSVPRRSPSQPPLLTKNVGVPPVVATCRPQAVPGVVAAPSCVQTIGDAPMFVVRNTPVVVEITYELAANLRMASRCSNVRMFPGGYVPISGDAPDSPGPLTNSRVARPVLKQHIVVSARVPSPPESKPSQQRSLFQVTGVAPPLVAPKVPVS